MMNGLRRGDMNRGEKDLHDPSNRLSIKEFPFFPTKAIFSWERMDAFLIRDLRPQESKY